MRCPTYATWCEPGMSLGALTAGDLKVIGALAFLNAINTNSEQKNEDSGEMVLIASPMS